MCDYHAQSPGLGRLTQSVHNCPRGVPIIGRSFGETARTHSFTLTRCLAEALYKRGDTTVSNAVKAASPKREGAFAMDRTVIRNAGLSLPCTDIPRTPHVLTSISLSENG